MLYNPDQPFLAEDTADKYGFPVGGIDYVGSHSSKHRRNHRQYGDDVQEQDKGMGQLVAHPLNGSQNTPAAFFRFHRFHNTNPIFMTTVIFLSPL